MKDKEIKCIGATINISKKEHILTLRQTSKNTGLFGSKIILKQFEKIECALSKRYIKLPLGIRLLF